MTKEQGEVIYRLNLHKDTPMTDGCCIVNAEDIKIVLSMLEEKDKQIDLMAEAMRYYNGMQQKQEFCIDICEEKECNIEKCKERIKQYFENKAKESE